MRPRSDDMLIIDPPYLFLAKILPKTLEHKNDPVKPTEISKIIKEKDGIQIQPSMIQLMDDIKSLGDFKVNINLHTEVQAQIKIKVIPAEVIQ